MLETSERRLLGLYVRLSVDLLDAEFAFYNWDYVGSATPSVAVETRCQGNNDPASLISIESSLLSVAHIQIFCKT